MAADSEQAFNDVVKLAMYSFPQAHQTVVQHTLMEAIRELVTETCLLQTSVRPHVEESVADYDLSELMPEGFEICEIMWVKLHECCIDPINECHPCPTGYEMVGTDCIRLHPSPCGYETDSLEVKVAARPCMDACVLPKEVMKERKLLKEMVEVAMMNIPNKPWTDYNRASRLETRVMGCIADIRSAVARRLAPKQHNNKLTQIVACRIT